MGVSDLTACEARNRLADIYKNSEPDSHRAALIEQAVIALYEQSDKQGKLPYDVLTFALHASLRVGDRDTVERIIDLLMPLDPLLVGEQITAGQSIDLIDLNEDEDNLIENHNSRNMGNAAAFEDELQDELGFKIPEMKLEPQKKPSPQVTERVEVESQLEEEVLFVKPKPFMSQTEFPLVSPMVSQISPRREFSSIVEQPLSGGIGGGKLGEVSELAQVSKQLLVQTLSTQSTIGSEMHLSTPQNGSRSVSL
ncbi:hypothetical protein [Shewanella surugensis]|uniref:Uncharacterized protein n=1 Tax=Shewanella surugensis TaxID=212020 RepID=A0ABT0L7K7_9GAMM|nr:hypothetical protein [Shewanella surugensis]MCL1123668.1 hypothetical protein [Shewanella surugensis]